MVLVAFDQWDECDMGCLVRHTGEKYHDEQFTAVVTMLIQVVHVCILFYLNTSWCIEVKVIQRDKGNGKVCKWNFCLDFFCCCLF